MNAPVLAFTNKKATKEPAKRSRLVTKNQRLEHISEHAAGVVESLVDEILKELESVR
jgi:hypothetical protein